MKKNKEWTKKEIESVIDMVDSGKSYDEMAKVLKRSYSGIKSKIQELGFKTKGGFVEKRRCILCGDVFLIGNKSKKKFCSSSCAASFNNRNRKVERGKKKHVKCVDCGCAVEVSNRTSKKKCLCEECKIKRVSKKKGAMYDKNNKYRICTSCGDVIENKGSAVYCNECRECLKNKKLFIKLGVLSENLKISNKKALKILTKEYFTNKKSLIQIREEYNIMFNTVHFFFKKNGIDLRTLNDAQKTALKEGRKTINADPVYKTGYHISWFGKKYFFRSSYEERMMKYLDSIKEFYLYESLIVDYEFKNEIHPHITDFHLPERNLIIETKGEWFQKRDKKKNEAKKKAIISEGYYYMMAGDWEIKQFENGKERLKNLE